MSFFRFLYLLSVIPSLFVFAQSPCVVDLENLLKAETDRGAVLAARIEKLEAARLQSVVITDPATQAFANLPYVVRIRIKDSAGVNFGTGTVVKSEKGEAVILTAGHIFRKFDKKNSKIEVDVFNPKTGKIETFSGSAMDWDLDGDVGLLSIPANRIIPALPVASLEDAATPGQRVLSYGCGGGAPPSPEKHKVTSLNRYDGPDTVECTGVPLQGRSGGALVDNKNRLIGVIIAADTRDQRGLHAGLKPIHDLLIKVGIEPATLPCNPPPLPVLPKK